MKKRNFAFHRVINFGAKSDCVTASIFGRRRRMPMVVFDCQGITFLIRIYGMVDYQQATVCDFLTLLRPGVATRPEPEVMIARSPSL